MKIYFVTANEKKIEQSKNRFERFIECVHSEERARLEIEFYVVRQHLDQLGFRRNKK